MLHIGLKHQTNDDEVVEVLPRGEDLSKFRSYVIRKKAKLRVQESSAGLAARAASVDLSWKRPLKW